MNKESFFRSLWITETAYIRAIHVCQHLNGDRSRAAALFVAIENIIKDTIAYEAKKRVYLNDRNFILTHPNLFYFCSLATAFL